MYSGIMDKSLGNLSAVTDQLGSNRKARVANNNADDYRTSMNVEQNTLMNDMQATNPDMYNYMLKQKMVQNNMQPSRMDMLMNIFGGK